FAMGQQFVEFLLAKHGTQGGLGELRGLIDVVRNLYDGFRGINHTQKDDRIHLQRDVVTSDDVLWRDFERFLAQRDAHDAVDGREDQNDPGTLRTRQQTSEAEDHTAFVLSQNLDGTQEIENDDDACHYGQKIHVRTSSALRGRKHPLK